MPVAWRRQPPPGSPSCSQRPAARPTSTSPRPRRAPTPPRVEELRRRHHGHLDRARLPQGRRRPHGEARQARRADRGPRMAAGRGRPDPLRHPHRRLRRQGVQHLGQRREAARRGHRHRHPRGARPRHPLRRQARPHRGRGLRRGRRDHRQAGEARCAGDGHPRRRPEGPDRQHARGLQHDRRGHRPYRTRGPGARGVRRAPRDGQAEGRRRRPAHQRLPLLRRLAPGRQPHHPPLQRRRPLHRDRQGTRHEARLGRQGQQGPRRRRRRPLLRPRPDRRRGPRRRR